MVRYVFFSFHFDRDIWRANQVRNSWVCKDDKIASGFLDKAGWEKVQKEGDEAIKRWIDSQMSGTSVTVVLIGKETSSRDWVRYEVKKSHAEGKGLLGVYIHSLKDENGKTDEMGNNQFGDLPKNEKGESGYFWQLYPTYDYLANDGYNNLGNWIEAAAKKAGR